MQVLTSLEVVSRSFAQARLRIELNVKAQKGKMHRTPTLNLVADILLRVGTMKLKRARQTSTDASMQRAVKAYLTHLAPGPQTRDQIAQEAEMGKEA